MIKKKRGMLLASEVVKLVIALIGIALLVYLLISIYYTSVHDQELNQAKATTGRLKEIIQRVEAGAIQSEKITDVTPDSWYFFSFVGGEKKPNSCVGQNCLCICEKVSYDNVNVLGIQFAKDRQLTECDSGGVCITISNLNKFQTFKIKNPKDGGTDVEVLKISGNIGIRNI